MQWMGFVPVTGIVLACALVPAGASAQGTTALVSRSSSGAQGLVNVWAPDAVSDDGRFAAFTSSASNLAVNDTNGTDDVFLHDRLTGQTTIVSVSSSGAQANGPSWIEDMTPDARFVVFMSQATNLSAADTDSRFDVYVRDRLAGTTELVSTNPSGVAGNGDSGWANITPDGRWVAFMSYASDLVPGDTNGWNDVFVHDRTTGATSRVSVNSAGVESNNDNGDVPSISADGRIVCFWSYGTNLVPGDLNQCADVFVHDNLLGTTALVSISSSGAAADSTSETFGHALSADGHYAVFTSWATDIVPGDTNQHRDSFLRDLLAGTTTRISMGVGGAQADEDSMAAAITPDARYAVLVGWATNLVPGDTNGAADIFVHDIAAGSTTRISLASDGSQANWASDAAEISGDGRFVVFRSSADNLVSPDLNGTDLDLFVRDLQGCSPTIATYCTAGTTTHSCVPSIAASGTPSASAGSGFTITVSAVEGQRTGLVFYGIAGPRETPFGGGSSVLCVAGQLRRTQVQASGGTNGACDGQLSLDWNQYILAHPLALGMPFRGGETVWAQAWFRDPPAPGGVNLSNGIWFEVCP
jgi:hypothetical protein